MHRRVRTRLGRTSAVSRARALERSTVRRLSMRREDDLDRQREEGQQSFDDLLAGHASPQPLVDLQPPAEVDQRVAWDHRSDALDPEYEVVVLPPVVGVDADRKPVARRIQVSLAAAPGEQPGDVGAAPNSLLGSNAMPMQDSTTSTTPQFTDS
jgi:hypothetical protein